MDTAIELEVCVDCIMAIANGDYPENNGRAVAVVNGEGRWADDGYHLVAGSGECGFSRTPCDCCGSHLHGDRHQATALLR